MNNTKKAVNQVLVSNLDPKFKIRRKAVKSFALRLLHDLNYKNTKLSIVFMTDAGIKKINEEFLSHDWATDVLAFPFQLPFLGEIIISIKRAQVQAQRFDASFKEELARYICHGILHLSGFKDKKPAQQKKMREKENQLLRDNCADIGKIF